MNMTCSRCKKRIAVVFLTRMEGDSTVNEGLCLRCAKELGIKPVSDMMENMGVSEEDFDRMSDQLMSIGEDENGFEPGGAQTFPFIENLFGGSDGKSTGENAPRGNLPGGNSPDEKSRAKKKSDKSGEKAEKKRKFLDNYCENLTLKAREGRIDRIVGREKEISRVVQILNRRSKNNPCLIGEPGVGKTAVAEGIALKIAAGDVPAKLRGSELFMLDLTALVAGTQFRGQFESRVKGLVEEARAEGNIILFIDEVHNLVSAGDSEGSMNAANILKPALSRGEIQVIGATTFNEYRKYIEKDAALERRFQPVTVNEPSIEDAIEVIRGVKGYYEDYHHVKVSDSMVRNIVVLSERYIFDRFLPDKAIDLLDESCSCAELRSKELEQYQQSQLTVESMEEQEQAMESDTDNIDYEKLAELKAGILREKAEMERLEPVIREINVTEEDVAHVIELWTGIPASKIQESELKKVADLESTLKTKIIGQDEAVHLVAQAVRRSRIRLGKVKRPASFIFVGPTGVGKTELVKVLSAELFDETDPLIRLDMSEFMEKFSVSRIVGSPPGYVGYDEAGQLTEKVRRKPYSVVLFDEIEKAHPDVMNILLQILDEGKITDAHGRAVSFENTVIVMTSNAGNDRRENALGFAKSADSVVKEKVLKGLGEFLRPEFLGRVDEIVVFRSLDEGDFGNIARLMLEELKSSLDEKGIGLAYTDDALACIAKQSFGKKGGARDIRRVVRQQVEDAICLMMVSMENYPESFLVSVASGDEKVEVRAVQTSEYVSVPEV